ncbi:MAG TPA: hypothetical protein VFZ22_05585 [Pyrinomonadaceae bacterium]|nr:hypothetical protein [Pyrinomonadaceae bacterium]
MNVSDKKAQKTQEGLTNAVSDPPGEISFLTFVPFVSFVPFVAKT